MLCIQVSQMMHKVRPRHGNQDEEAEQYTKGEQPVSDGDALAHSLAHCGSRTHPGFPPMHCCDGLDIVRPSQRFLLGLVAAAVQHSDLLQLITRHGDGLSHHLVANCQILDVHEVIAALEPCPWANSNVTSPPPFCARMIEPMH
jgi:hypothetical protein